MFTEKQQIIPGSIVKHDTGDGNDYPARIDDIRTLLPSEFGGEVLDIVNCMRLDAVAPLIDSQFAVSVAVLRRDFTPITIR